MTTKYTPDLAPRFHSACCEGKSLKQIATEFMVYKDTFEQWSKDADKPEFTEAYKLGKQAAEAFYEEMGRRNLIDPDPKFKDSLYKFVTGVRFNWSEKSEQTIKNKETPTSEAELDQLIQEKLKALGLTETDVKPQ